MKQKLLSVVLTIAMLLTCIPLGAVSVSAATYAGLNYKIENDQVTITGYTSAVPADLVIPTEIEGYPVTKIADWAFGQCSKLTSVEIPGSVTTIGRNAFNHCSSLKTVTMGYGVTTLGVEVFYECTVLTSVALSGSLTVIEQGMFWNCTALTSVVIPEGVTTIGSCAFYNSGLTSITIPVSINNIAWGAFSGCTKLTDVYYGGIRKERDKITISSSNDFLLSATWHCNVDPAEVLRYKIVNGMATITGYTDGLPANLIIPATIDGYPVTAISNYAFYKADLTSIDIPDSVTTIGDYVFYWCTSLTKVNLGSGVTTIGYGVFEYCDSMVAITVSAANPNYTSADGVLFNEDKTTLIQCPRAKTGAFTIPDSVTTIGEEAFYYCDSLNSVTIPNSVTTIGKGAFKVCKFSSVFIPNSVTYIGAGAFANCVYLKSVTIPDSVVTIGDHAFAYCYNMTAITVSATNPNYTSWGGVLFNKDLTELIQCPCGKIGSYTVPNGVTTIAKDAFFYCGITSVTIPGSVTTIGEYAFFNCPLTSVTIGNGVTTIGECAFDACYALTSVTIPKSVTSIGEWAFANCGKLSNVYYAGTKEDRAKINIVDFRNDDLLSATWHYNCINPKDHYSADVQHSVMDTENGNGLAFRFELIVDGVVKDKRNVADLSNATMRYLGNTCKVVEFGAVLTNNETVSSDLTLDKVNDYDVQKVPAVYLQEVAEGSCAFATRIVNIPEHAQERTLYARPYYIVEVDGEWITIYGDVDSASCTEYM